MADDRMKNDEQRQNMSPGGREDDEIGRGQQSPGRNPQGGQQSGGQHTGGQQQGGQKKGNLNMDDEDEFGGGTSGQRGGQDRGGQNR